MTPEEHADIVLSCLREGDALTVPDLAARVGLDIDRTLAALDVLANRGAVALREGDPPKWYAPDARPAVPPPVVPDDTKVTQDNVHELLDALLRRQRRKR